MILPLLALLILSADAPARHPDAAEVFQCDFGAKWDADYDGWPDGWERQVGPTFPPYLRLNIVPTGPGGVGPWFRMDLDGGNAALYSPQIPVDSQFSYFVEATVATEGSPDKRGALKHDSAYVTLTFLGREGEEIATVESARFKQSPDGERIRIGPLQVPPGKIVGARLGLHLRGGAQNDLKGAALFRDIWMGRLPRMTLSVDRPFGIFPTTDGVNVTCEVSGIAEREPQVRFELWDLTWMSSALRDMPSHEPVAATTVPFNSAGGKTQFFRGTATWKPPIPAQGRYQIVAALVGEQSALHRRTTDIVVSPPDQRPATGEFGWCMPRAEELHSLDALPGLLSDAGVHWVKFPIWYSEAKERTRADRLARFADLLGRKNIELVGLLDQPPADVRPRFGGIGKLPAAAIFTEKELWQPALDPVITRLSLKVRWWQLGSDDDGSFLGHPDLEKKLKEVKARLERFGQEVHLGFGWRWLDEAPRLTPEAAQFLWLTADPALTGDELVSNLNASKSIGRQRWVSLEPLPPGKYARSARIADLVSRMLSAKVGGADGIFLPEPFSAEHGVMSPDGSPGELFLPWSTTAKFLSGAKFTGELPLPGGSSNRLFTHDDEAVLVLWHPLGATEKLYLGERITQTDLGGRTTTLSTKDGVTEIAVGPLPVFLRGLNPRVAEWIMSATLPEPRLASIMTRAQPLPLKVKNTFAQGVRAEVTLVGPEMWDVRPKKAVVNLAAGEEATVDFEVMLRPDAASGPQPIRIDFDVAAERRLQFSSYRSVQVGLGDLKLELTSHLDDDGQLVIEQRLINETDVAVNFNCFLFAPDRRRMRRQVFELQRGRDVKLYVFPDGKDLLGKTLWVRAEEIEGERVLNQWIVAEE